MRGNRELLLPSERLKIIELEELRRFALFEVALSQCCLQD
jgi:hypothetical protein